MLQALLGLRLNGLGDRRQKNLQHTYLYKKYKIKKQVFSNFAL